MCLFQQYIDIVHGGNQSSAANALGVDRSLISRILNGTRSITPDMAEKIEADSGGRFPKEHLVFGPPEEGERRNAA